MSTVIKTIFSISISFAVSMPASVPHSVARDRTVHPVVEIKPFNDTPTIFINGKPNAGLTYMTYDIQPRQYGLFGKIGVDLASVSVSADYSPYFDQPVGWLGPGQYDFSDIDNKMKLILDANPDVYVFPRVYMCSPPWWDEENPGELVRWHDGRIEIEKPFGKKGTYPSWSSEKYRKASVNNLRQFIRHVRKQWYADRIIGYHIASGSTEEWFYWNCGGDDFQDYSDPALKEFRKWLNDRYKSDEALKKAWNNPDVTIDTAEIPAKEERKAYDLFIWRDPAKRKNVIDHYTFYCEQVTNMISLLARAAKEEVNESQLVGVFYGYSLHPHVDNYLQNNGHLAMHKFLQNKDIDFFTAPTAYVNREVGTGYSWTQVPTEPIKLYGKLWMDENDVRTHLIPWQKNYGRTANLKDSEALQIRQLATMLAHGWGAWWFDMEGGWYDEPEFLKIIERLNAIGEKSIHFDRTPVSEIAVVYDEHSIFYTDPRRVLTEPLIYNQIQFLGKIGAPFDYVYLNDLDKAPLYKMYIFLNSFHVTAEQKASVERLRTRGARTLLWLYGAGFAGNNDLSPENSSELTGINITMEEKSGPLYVKVNKQGSAFLPSVEEGLLYGTDNIVGPLLYADDPDADVLGILPGHGVPGLVHREINGLSVYYSSAPTLPPSLMRGIAAKAGVHIYNYQDDGLYVNRSFISIHTGTAGVRHIRLPEKSDVYDIYNNKLIARNTSRFSIDLPVRHTVLYYLGSEKEWSSY